MPNLPAQGNRHYGARSRFNPAARDCNNFPLGPPPEALQCKLEIPEVSNEHGTNEKIPQMETVETAQQAAPSQAQPESSALAQVNNSPPTTVGGFGRGRRNGTNAQAPAASSSGNEVQPNQQNGAPGNQQENNPPRRSDNWGSRNNRKRE